MGRREAGRRGEGGRDGGLEAEQDKEQYQLRGLKRKRSSNRKRRREREGVEQQDEEAGAREGRGRTAADHSTVPQSDSSSAVQATRALIRRRLTVARFLRG